MHVPVELWNRTSGFLGLDDHGCDCKYIQMSHSCYHTDSSIKLFCLQIFSKAASWQLQEWVGRAAIILYCLMQNVF